MAERKKIKHQDAGAALIEWFLSLPDLMQSSILGQIDEESRGMVAETLLRQMAAPPKKGEGRTLTIGRVRGPEK